MKKYLIYWYCQQERRKNIMKKFLRDNKGVIIFYAELVIITLIVLNNLQKGSDKMINNDDMIRISLLTLLSIVIGAIITYVGFTYNRYDVNKLILIISSLFIILSLPFYKL